MASEARGGCSSSPVPAGCACTAAGPKPRTGPYSGCLWLGHMLGPQPLPKEQASETCGFIYQRCAAIHSLTLLLSERRLLLLR